MRKAFLTVLGFELVIAVSACVSRAAANTATDISSISAGGFHVCALTTAGGVTCWGETGAGSNSTVPTEVTGLTSGIAAVSSGYFFSCALTTAGGVKCWGIDEQGQLGDRGACGTLCPTPIDVPGLTTGVAAVSSGVDHACVLTTTGGVTCWGSDSNGQLGVRDRSCGTCPPIDVVGLTSGVAAISAGYEHTCALTTAGGVKCWGRGGFLGNGSADDSTTPVDVCATNARGPCTQANGNELTGISAISDTCALTVSGGVKCWYDGYPGTPLDVVGLTSGVVAISRSCAVASAGAAKCWGANDFGQLGNGTFDAGTVCVASAPPCVTIPAAVDVSGLTHDVRSVASGEEFACALMTEGAAYCWGSKAATGAGAVSCWIGFPCDTVPQEVLSLTKPPTGDVDCDGSTNAVDAEMLLQGTAGLSIAIRCGRNADVNRDGVSNAIDVAVILQFVAGLIPNLPT